MDTPTSLTALRPERVAPLPRARIRDAARIAELLAFAFTLGGKREPDGHERHLVWVTVPGMFLISLLGISLRQFWWRPGATLQLEDQRFASRVGAVLRGPVAIGFTSGLVLAVLVAIGVPPSILAAVTGVAGVLFALALVAIIASAVSLGIAGRTRRQARRAAGLTHSRRTRSGVITEPPRSPQWKISYLAGDPRMEKSDALLTAASTLQDRIPAGHVVWTVAASPALMLVYRRWGFVQWHKKSMAMWAVTPSRHPNQTPGS